MNLLKVDTLDQVKEKLHPYFSGMSRTTEEVPLFEAVGRYLAEDLPAPSDIPETDRSVVDGYALKASETFGVSESSPALLELIGEVEMGKGATHLVEPGKAVYVPTGGMVPTGADSVVMIEYVEKMDEHNLAVYGSVAPGAGIMRKGDDFRKDQVLYQKGHRISNRDIGLLAAMGYAFVTVFSRPVVAIISTGDEVVSIMEEPGPGQVRDINSYSLAALVTSLGGKVGTVALIRDSREDLRKMVREALMRNHIVLISGGSSAGFKDYTAAVINEMGSPGVLTHGIAMKPGKPTIVGVIKDEHCCCHERASLVVGLPGHPMAAVISFRAVVEDFIRKYYFCNEEEPMTIPARMTENIHGGEGRETFTMVRLRKTEAGWEAEPIHAKSGSISQLRYGDGFLRMPALSEGVSKGQLVEIRPWNEV